MQPGQGEFMAPAQPIQQPKKEAKGGALVAISIICLLIGIGGVGFGVYQMTQKPKTATSDNQNLKIQIEKDDGTKVEIDTDKITNDGNAITISNSAANLNGDYLYLGKHLKGASADGDAEYVKIAIKLPEEGALEYLSFNYRDHIIGGQVPVSILKVNAVTPNTYDAQALPEFVGDDTAELGTIQIYSADDFAKITVTTGVGDVVKQTDDYVIAYQHPMAASYGMDSDETLKNWADETVRTIKAWLSDESNYIEL